MASYLSRRPGVIRGRALDGFLPSGSSVAASIAKRFLNCG